MRTSYCWPGAEVATKSPCPICGSWPDCAGGSEVGLLQALPRSASPTVDVVADAAGVVGVLQQPLGDAAGVLDGPAGGSHPSAAPSPCSGPLARQVTRVHVHISAAVRTILHRAAPGRGEGGRKAGTCPNGMPESATNQAITGVQVCGRTLSGPSLPAASGATWGRDLS